MGIKGNINRSNYVKCIGRALSGLYTKVTDFRPVLDSLVFLIHTDRCAKKKSKHAKNNAVFRNLQKSHIFFVTPVSLN